MVLHMVVITIEIIIINNNVHIIIPLGIHNSNVNHNCWILPYFLPKHIHWFSFFFSFFLFFTSKLLSFFFFFHSLLNKPVHNITSFKNKKNSLFVGFWRLFLCLFFCDKQHSRRKQTSFSFISSFWLFVEFYVNRKMIIDNKRKIEELWNIIYKIM